MSRKSLMTPVAKSRKSMLGFSSASSKLHQGSISKIPQKKLLFSANKGKLLSSGSSRWSSQGTVKDTRNLSNKAYQRLMVDEIIEFLNESGYPHQITVKILSAPSIKEFLRIFEHLFNFLTPNFVVDQKKYTEEIPRLLKTINFPFQISKSTMSGVGSLHSWPQLLGILHWLAVLIQTVNSIDVECVLFPESLQDDFVGNLKQLFFEHNSRCYIEFLQGMDDFSEAQKYIEIAAMREAGLSEDDHEASKFEVAELEEQVLVLEAEPDVLAEALKQKADLQDMIDQYLQTINELDQEISVLNQQHVQLAAQNKEEGVGFAQLGDNSRQEEIKRHSSEIEVQITRLNSEKERLEQQNFEREVRFSRVYNKFSTIANEYNDIAMKLTPNPLIHQYIGGENSIVLQFDHSHNNLNDFKLRLKPLLVKLSHQISDDRYKLESQKIEMEHQLDKMNDQFNEKSVELVQLKNQVARMEKELESNIEFFEKEYISAMDQMREKEELLDKRQKEVSENLEDTKRQFAIKKKKYEESHEKQIQEQNAYVFFLQEYGRKALEYKKYVESQIDRLNANILSEIQKVAGDERGVRNFLQD